MDILFSPYSGGGMPKAAMAEVERRTEELLKSSSFQRMLELEKKYKVERLRGPQSLLPSPQFSVQPRGDPPLRPERPDALFPQEKFLMVKATRRDVVLPSLSVTIPTPADDESRGRPTRRETDQEDADVGTPTNDEPHQKQVKFAASEDGGDDEDGMSEQSSICQSPSWEGYGQRKKEKKLEAERRKREKEQAEKEAKAAKRRSTSRLSKPPPPLPTARDSRIGNLTHADRSMSDPFLVSQYPAHRAQTIFRPDDLARAASADDLPQSRRQRPAVAEVLCGSGSNYRRPEGSTTQPPHSPLMPHHSLGDKGNAFAARQDLQRSTTEGPAPLNPQLSPAFPPRHDARSQPDVCPPSASRTPKLRHTSPSPSGTTQSNNVFQGSSSANHSQESLSSVTGDGARRPGYVRYQRAQAAERAMAGLVDEQLIRSVEKYYPPSRSISGGSQHARRPSFTQEAKSVAMKLVGMKTPSAAANDAVKQNDCLAFKAIPYSASGPELSASVSTMPVSPATTPCSTDDPHESSTSDRPPTSQSSVGLGGLSGSGTSGKKGRSLKDAAKAAFSISKGHQKPVDGSRLSVPMPPYLALRGRLQSRTTVHAESKDIKATEDASVAASDTTAPASVSGSAKQSEMGLQGGYRGSEGSSSSSAYGDGSPLPSPTTTPDTSRPQSAKDVPLTASQLVRSSEPSGLQDDERTLRQSLDFSNSSTPRVADSEQHESVEAGSQDRWSRTALTLDIDFDAQSFMSTFSHLDNVDEAEHPSLPYETTKPELLKPVSKPEVNTEDRPPAQIPPQSRRRDRSLGTAGVSSPPAERRRGVIGKVETTGILNENEETRNIKEPPKSRVSRNFARPLGRGEEQGKTEEPPERSQVRQEHRRARSPESGKVEEQKETRSDEEMQVPTSPHRDWVSGPASSASSTAGSTSPHALTCDYQFPSNPYFTDLSDAVKDHVFLREIRSSAGTPSTISLPSPLHPVTTKPPAQARTTSAPNLSSASTATSRSSTPSLRPSATVPVSILKQPKNPPVLSALPKHIQQLQTGISTRNSTTTLAETRMAPIAKMFVECCSCKFYHDMPSKLYECMAKPDAVMQDPVLGISGAITTMVKCPWCQHNMSRNCCAGYAAVVYLKEKLH
ncbi:hypothetical protein VTI74DRAFT_4503 [Chaetomium olivicolor]